MKLKSLLAASCGLILVLSSLAGCLSPSGAAAPGPTAAGQSPSARPSSPSGIGGETSNPTPRLTLVPTAAPSASLSEQSTSTPSPSPSPAPSPAPSPSPVPTPTVKAKPTPAPSPSPTVKPKPAPASSPVPTAAADDGKVVLADGFYYIKLDSALKARITGLSYPAEGTNGQITYDDLRYIRLLYVDFEGTVREGEIMVNVRLADEVMSLFYELFLAEYPLASVRLVDDYGEPADDDRSMAANNTSGFNYRYVTGTRTLSRHSFGAAIDINPLFNPYLIDGKILPPEGAIYADRTWDFPGKIDHDDLCYRLFIKRGWSWGGDWADPDYQHFSKKIS